SSSHHILSADDVNVPRDTLLLSASTATTAIYTLSLHDALPISLSIGIWKLLILPVTLSSPANTASGLRMDSAWAATGASRPTIRSEEHTSELQSLTNLVCRLLLEKKKILDLPHDKRCPTANTRS